MVYVSDGSDYGDGAYGDTYGDGSGCGGGSYGGAFYGFSSDDGEGEGYGCGYYGYSSDDGYGYSYGEGSDEGYGYSGTKQYWAAVLERCLESIPPLQTEEAVTYAFWKSDQNGRATNGGSRTFIAKPGLMLKVSGSLRICTANALHGTLCPPEWHGERCWVVALIGETVRRDNKIAALKRIILADVKDCLDDA